MLMPSSFSSSISGFCKVLISISCFIMSTNLFLFLQLRTEATFSTLLGVGLSVEDIEPEFMEDRVGSILEGTMDDNVDGVMGSLIVDSILEGGDEKIEFELTVDKAEDSVELRRISLYEDFTKNVKQVYSGSFY